MATVQDNQDEEQQGYSNQSTQGQSAPQGTTSATPSSTGSSSEAPGGSKAPSGGPSQSQNNYNPSAPTSSGNFTNLKSYLGANNNGQDFSNQVNTNLQNQGTALNTNIQGASTNFNNQVQSNVAPVQQNYQAYQQVAANNDPNAIVNYANQGNNAQNIQGLENATYTGPSSLNNLSGAQNGAVLQSGVNNYQNLANDTSSDAGRMNLLQSLYGNQNYGQGQQTLDNVFLQGNNFGNTRSQANQLNNAYNTAANNATTSAQNASNAINQAATGTVNSLNNAVNNQNQNIQTNYNTALGNQASANATDTAALQSGTISQQLATQLGLTGGTNLWDVDPSQFLQNAQLTAGNTATAQDYGNIAALHNLLGNNANNASSQILSQYGTQPANLLTPDQYLTYNNAGLTNATGNAAQAYHDAVYGNNQSQNNGQNTSLFQQANNGIGLFGNATNILSDPTTMTGNTFSKVGTQDNANPGVNLTPQELAYYQSQGDTGAATATAAQQAQIQALQQLANGAAGNGMSATPYEQQLATLNQQIASEPQQLTAAAMNTANPLQYLQSVYNQGGNAWKNLQNSAGGPGAYADLGALQGILALNAQYDPTKQLKIAPNPPESDA